MLQGRAEMIIFKNNSERLKQEYQTQISVGLKYLLTEINEYIKEHLDEDTTVTCFIRTQEEQDKLFDEGKAKTHYSSHIPIVNPDTGKLEGNGADIRSKNWLLVFKYMILEWILETFVRVDGLPVAKLEGISTQNEHLHIQFRKLKEVA